MAKTVAWLRQLSSGEISISLLSPHPLQAGKEVIIGRDPSCTLALDAYRYEGVSRRHALIRPSRHSSSSLWEVVDQKSANGTYVNGNLITQPQILQSGDRIRLGEAGPEFSIEYSSSAVSTIPLKPGQNPQNLSSIAPPPLVTPVNLSTSPTPQPRSPTDGKTATSPSLTQLIPILSTGKDLKQKAFLIPASLTVISVILMFVFIGSFKVFSVILAFYIAGIAYYFIYQLCGKSKPWWLLMGSGIGTMLLLYTPVWILIASLFRELLPGDVFALSTEASFITHFITHFFGAGMAEELLKAIPIFIALYWGTLSSPSWRGKIGVEEPLDGILIGTASAVGFTLIETLDQYVPNIVDAAGEV
ncbi:MAG: hypothetical protein RLZZ568_1707, partial [Cyanobacteriota bacterium]